MLPILANGTKLPDGDDINALGVIKSTDVGGEKWSHFHLHLRNDNRSAKCLQTSKSATLAEYTERIFLEQDPHDEIVDSLHDTSAESFAANFLEIMKELDDPLEQNDEYISDAHISPELKSNAPVARRTTPNKTHRIQSTSVILGHLIKAFTEHATNTMVAESENVYTPLISRLGRTEVERILLSSLDNDIDHLYHKGLLDLNSLQQLDSDRPLSYRWPGVYIHVIFSKCYPNTYWLYVGAAKDVKERISQHYKFRRVPSRASLHYHIWNSPGERLGDFFVLLGGFKSLIVDQLDIFPLLNMLEHWSCLIWQTLPSTILKRDLPFDFRITEPNIHLNRASALRQKYNVKGTMTQGNIETASELAMGARDLLTSDDPEIHSYFERRGRFYNLPLYRKLEGLRLGKALQVQSYFKECTAAVRQRASFDPKNLTRGPIQEHEVSVLIQCAICKHPDTLRVDPAPLYEIETGLYIRRALACRSCPSETGISGRWAGSREKCLTEPMDTTIMENSTTMESVRRKGRRHRKLTLEDSDVLYSRTD